jgi:exodeoxyribonuclease III
VRKRQKEPGKGSCRKARGKGKRHSSVRVCAPVSTRRQGRVEGRSKPSERSEPGLPTARRSKRGARSQGAATEPGSAREHSDELDRAARERRLAQSQGDSETKENMRGEPVRTNPREEELEDVDEDDGEEWEIGNEGDTVDYEDNLPFYEDSLSILQGEINTEWGTNLPMYVTTDTGSMTQLMQTDFALKLKLQRRELPSTRCFNINSPGGGGEEITEYVVVPMRIKAKREMQPREGYEECLSEEEEIVIRMRFGLCDNLPVPILWGGKQMRKYELEDHHSTKTLSMTVRGCRYLAPSISWLAATGAMGEITDSKLKKAYKPFRPSQERLANIVLGGRKAANLPAILYPGRDNLVRVGRNGARVDEGYNEILVLNGEELAEQYGEWVVPIDCVTNGEAFLIVRNNSDQPVRLSPGVIKIEIRPAVSFPKVVAPGDLERYKGFSSPAVKTQSSKGLKDVEGVGLVETDEESGSQDEDESRRGQTSPAMAMLTQSRVEEPKMEQGPERFLTWNCNGLTPRMKTWRKEAGARSSGSHFSPFYGVVWNQRPDLISLQEVRLRCEPGDCGRVLRDSEDEKTWREFMRPLKNTYDAYLSLSSEKYGGQAILVRKSLETPTVTYNMGGQRGHYKSGRFVKIEFQHVVVRSVYVPFNGAGQPGHLTRRKQWDAQMKEEMKDTGSDKARLLLGDLNVAHKSSDMSNHQKFWKMQGDQGVAEGDRGFGGTTDNERARFQEAVEEGGWADTFGVPLDTAVVEQFTFRGEGKFKGKGLKLDYVFADNELVLSGGVESSEVLCSVMDREGFLGSDHAPLQCVLHPRWQQRRANLLAHYEAWAPVEAKRTMDGMFNNTAAKQSLPKVMAALLSGGKALEAHLKIKRPKEFPEDLWEYVQPDQRPLVQGRLDSFKDKIYLAECMEKIISKLDIQPREEFYTPEWFEAGEGRPALQEHFMRAQAAASPHIYFFPDPDKVEMAKDVVAEVVTTSDKPFKCRPRKLSVVQQAFLQAKTNIMLGMKQLEEANSEWCHGLVLVAYPERIQTFMEAHGETAMKDMFEVEHQAEVATFFRLCVDLRMLNARTVPDRFPLPRIDSLLESIPRDCGRYSISDIADAFFICEVK